MKATLDAAVPREVSEVEVIIETNLGESRRYVFGSIDAAIEFLEAFDEQEVLNDENGPSMWAISIEKANSDLDEDETNGIGEGY